MDYPVLKNELQLDPVSLGYSALTDTQAAAKLNAVDTGRTLNRTAVPAQEVFNAIDDGAWPTAGSLSESKLRTVLGMPAVDASNTNTRGIFGAVFPNTGATAATRTRLLAIGTQTVSRAQELGLGPVLVSDVTKARTNTW